MVKLADLVHIANNAKTDAQKNAVGEELKKLLRGAKGCDPKSQLYAPRLNRIVQIQKGGLYQIGKGAYGAVYYGCLDDKCNTKVAIKFTNEPSARMEYRIAQKLKGMGVPRVYHFKTCNNRDILYFEYINGISLEQWMRSGQSTKAYSSLISQLIGNLKKIHEKYPKFRHHDLHWNNVLVLKDNKPIMIDFGLATIEGVRNPGIDKESANEAGISLNSHPMYDVHYFLNIIHKYSNNNTVRKFVEDLLPKKYLGVNSDVIKGVRLRVVKHEGLPTYNDILNHPFLQEKKRPGGILRKFIPKPKTPPTKVGTSSAIRRARAVLQKEAEKKTQPLKRAPIRGRDPSVMNQVREIEKRLQPKPKTKTPEVVVRPKVFINKNGDVKIDTRKCRLYKKDELVKLFKLDPALTKEQMCKFIKNM
jgi:tRNA A-37 threonylcarbamoyl transferase component Bud32